MRRLVLCFDGTWNKPADEALPPDGQVETNVSRFYRSLSATGDDGVAQVNWYNRGVGTSGIDHLAGGALGAGLDVHIIDGYRHLAKTYEDGDEVFILGFSRGAYAARSLVGMVRNCGLVRPGFATEWRIGAAYGIYRTRDDGPDSAVARAFRQDFAREITIRFVGVWDTVGALGIPLHLAEGLNAAYYRFHDTRLSGVVQYAYQAIALDEHREDYDICLWDPSEQPGQTIEQRWFVGAHCDVGGGYPDRRLSDLPLRWMQDRARALGLGVDGVAVGPENDHGRLTDSYTAFLGGLYARTHPRHYRRVLSTPFGGEVLDPSVDRRRKSPDLAYAPPNPGLPELVA
jgi:uncharacterized protein (DUF2235 family)